MYKCKECKKIVIEKDLHYFEKVKIRLISQRLCFNCDFWTHLVKSKDNLISVRINSHHYTIGKENIDTGFRGFAGRKFVIKFKDGRQITTTNLWDNGEIPEHFRDRLTNNARFINEKEEIDKENYNDSNR